MIKAVEKLLKGNGDYFYFAFRVLAGLMFAQHGAQKLLGWFGGNQVELMSLFGLAGVIELFGGIMIATGLFTQIIALIGGAEMIYAFATVHLPKGWIPIMNGGELAALYFAAFLVLMTKGSGKWALENLLRK